MASMWIDLKPLCGPNVLKVGLFAISLMNENETGAVPAQLTRLTLPAKSDHVKLDPESDLPSRENVQSQ
jgi:hypothetical protein